MAIKMTGEGPKANVSGEETQQEQGLNFEDLMKQASDLIDSNTAPAEETPKISAQPLSNIEVLGNVQQRLKKERGYTSKKIGKKISYLTGSIAPKFEKMADAADDFHKAHEALKEQMSGLVENKVDADGNPVKVDAAEEFHKHISNLIFLAQRHLTAASTLEQRGQRTNASLSAEKLLNQRNAVRVRPEDIAGDRDDLGTLAPVTLDPGETPPPSEGESVRYINEFANSHFLTQAANSGEMGSVDHVKHAAHLLAGVTQAVHEGLNLIHSNIDYKKAMANNGKLAPLGKDAVKPFASLLERFIGTAKDYNDFAMANPGVREGDQTINGVAQRFGIENDLKFRNNLAKSGEYQKIIEQQHSKLRDWYNQKYGALIAKRDASRGRLVSTEVQKVNIPGEGTDVYPETSTQNIVNEYVNHLKSRGTQAQQEHEFRLRRPASASFLSGQKEVKLGDALNVPIRFNEDGSYKEHGAGFTVASSGTAQESTIASLADNPRQNKVNSILEAADNLKGLASSHPLTPRWHSIIDRAKTIILTHGMNEKRHEAAVRQSTSLLSKVQDSMARNDVLPKTEIREKTQGFPSYEEIAKIANVGKLPEEAKNSRIDEEVDPTWGGELSEMDIASGRGLAVPQYPSFMRPNPLVITNPSREGFHIPTDIGIRNSRGRRRAALAEAAERARASQDAEIRRNAEAGRGGGFFDLGGPAPLDVERDFFGKGKEEDKFVADDGLLKPSVDIAYTPSAKEDKEEAAAEELSGPEKKPRKAKESKSAETPAAPQTTVPGTTPGTSAAERAAALFNPGNRTR